MKLGSSIIQPKSPLILNNPDLRDSGIIATKRFIYLFFDSNALFNDSHNIPEKPGTVILGKAIQVNMCICEGGNSNIDLMPWIRGGKNSTYMVINMYTYDTRFNTSIRNIDDAEFTLINSIASSSTNDYDMKRCISNGISLYSKELRDVEKIDGDGFGFYDGLSPGIPEPIYYTIRQQETEIGDIYTIQSLRTVIVHFGFELIDTDTRVAILDMKMMDTMDLQMRDRIKAVKYMRNSGTMFDDINTYDSTQLSNEMLYNILESMQSGYTYIYDSDQGIGIGRNKLTTMPFQDLRMQDEMVNQIQRSMDAVEVHGKDLEKHYGHVRINFTPSYRGDKLDIYFKDYKPDNQPVIKNETNIDYEEKINEEITEYTSNFEDFFGYEDNNSY